MKNESAFPITGTPIGRNCLGLTKREYFAAKALQGLLADHTLQQFAYSRFAQAAVELADDLIAELEKQDERKD